MAVLRALVAEDEALAERSAGVVVDPVAHRPADHAQRGLPGRGVGARLLGHVDAGKAHFDVRGIRRQRPGDVADVQAAQRDADAAGAHCLYRGAGVRVHQVARLQAQDGALGRQREQRVGRQHCGHGVEEENLVAQQPAVFFMLDVFSDETDQFFEVGVDDRLATLLPEQLVADDALRGVEQRFANDIVFVVHGKDAG
jgi:hypothetical protein